MTFSVVMIVPAALRETGEALGVALGWGPGNFSVGLSGDGAAPATHYGLRAAAGEGFPAMLQAAAAGDGLGQGAVPPGVIQSLMAALTVDLRPDAARAGHFDDVIAAAGLRMVAEE